MSRYISLLRGINVGGKRKILMNDLKKLYEQLGFSNIATYIQSGNVVFDVNSKHTESTLVKEIEYAIHKAYGFDVAVMIRRVDEMKKMVESNPFLLSENPFDIEKCYVAFLKDAPTTPNTIKKEDYLPDKFERIEKNIFLYYAEKYSQSKLTNALFEQKFKLNATTRNWKTVKKLLEIAISK